MTPKKESPSHKGSTDRVGRRACGCGKGSKLIMKMNLGSIVVGLLLRHRPAMRGGDGEGRDIVQAKKSSKKFNFAKNQWGKKVKIKNNFDCPPPAPPLLPAPVA